MHIPDPEIEGLVKSPERIDLEMQYLRLCSVYEGNAVLEFINDTGVNPNATDRYKNNALMYALRPISYGLSKVNTIKALCKLGVSPMQQNMFGFSPMALASLTPANYGFCATESVQTAQYSVTLHEDGNKYDFARKYSDMHPKALDFPYPINLLGLKENEISALCACQPLDVSVKTYTIKLQQNSLFEECVSIFKANFKSVRDDRFIQTYINVYLKKNLKTLLWGFEDDKIEREE